MVITDGAIVCQGKWGCSLKVVYEYNEVALENTSNSLRLVIALFLLSSALLHNGNGPVHTELQNSIKALNHSSIFHNFLNLLGGFL